MCMLAGQHICRLDSTYAVWTTRMLSGQRICCLAGQRKCSPDSTYVLQIVFTIPRNQIDQTYKSKYQTSNYQPYL